MKKVRIHTQASASDPRGAPRKLEETKEHRDEESCARVTRSRLQWSPRVMTAAATAAAAASAAALPTTHHDVAGGLPRW